ncbi:MAG TPA: CBS domain-containing protein [Planctomycetota bacterium]|jgi:acetoin utilization protein AcuB|nr:CBS domain-containing protein [Planctomycetota bacterium]
MFVRSWMSTPVVALEERTPAADALELMQVKKIRRIPVLSDGRLVGILTQGDIQSVLGPDEHTARRSQTRLGDIMTRSVQTVEPDDPLERAARIMLEKGIAGLPVVEGERVIGMITESDIFSAFTRIMGVLETGGRVVMTIPEGDDLLEGVRTRTTGLSVRSLAAYPSPTGGWEVVVRVRGRALARVP